MPASASLQAALRVLYTKTGNLNSPQVEYILNLAAVMASGVGDTQLDKVWGDTRSISAGEDIDLIGTAIKDAFGDNLAMVDVCGVYVAADPGNTGNIIVGAGTAVLAAGAAAHTRIIKPAGFDFWFAPTGWPVAAGTTDLFHVAPSAGTQIYSAIIMGRSA